ncbi:MAG: restriction endonuclease subunit S, partial [Muribaculum sp.]|nr:restriction endonuclease subunit S [Muribaculum sp.]
ADSLANQQFANLKIRKSLEHRLSPMFIFYYLFVVGDFCRNNANSTCFQYVDMEGLKKLQVPIPTIMEQENIVTQLDKDTSNLTEAIASCERMISLLTERKQIIINEVVTGKKKVI